MIFTEEREPARKPCSEVFLRRARLMHRHGGYPHRRADGRPSAHEIAGLFPRWSSGAFVQYSNAAKNELLGLPTETISKAHAAVSETVGAGHSRRCSRAVAGARRNSRSAASPGPGGGRWQARTASSISACARQRGATVHLERRLWRIAGPGEIRLIDHRTGRARAFS